MVGATSAQIGQRIRDQAAERRRDGIRSVQDIAPLPAVENPARRAACIASLKLFCESYFPALFGLAWSANHLRAIEKLEHAIRFGDLFALAMPRGSGKTSLARAAALWAVLGGYRRFVVCIAANAGKAAEAIDAVKMFVRMNTLLYADFGPELHGFVKLENQSRRCDGQKCDGAPTNIGWGADEIIFPSIPGGVCNGAVITAFGIDSGNILGTQKVLSDGQTVIRPDFAIIDDPQTPESSKSQSQTADRLNIITADILGMAGPNVRISASVLCTVKKQNDLAERLLDRKQSPDWRGERMQLMDSMPTNMDLWDRYKELKDDCAGREVDYADATEFYRANREAMDEGAMPTWPERFDKTQISAVQYAMDFYYRSQPAFYSEMQNAPMATETSSTMRLTPNEICERINGTERGEVPVEGSILTAFIDVQQTCLWWCVAWFDQEFNGGVVDYGVFPEQGRSYFTLNDVQLGGKTLQEEYRNAAGLDGQLYGGLTDLTRELLGQEWQRRDGTKLRIERCLIDANWGLSTKIVKRFCRQSEFSAVLVPSHGRYVGATSTPFDQYTKKPGEKVGQGWRMPKPEDPRDPRHIAWDTNFWKSFFHARISTAMGDPGGFTLFGKRETASTHRMFADHCSAEFSVRVSAKGREVDEWQEKPGVDNHWFDCVVGCMVAASERGVMLAKAGEQSNKRKREVVRLSDIQRKR
jgi:hypothetical protein